jgi:hypothetical protein
MRHARRPAVIQQDRKLPAMPIPAAFQVHDVSFKLIAGKSY